MDKAAQIASSASIEAVKEPRGFIKFIELVIAIFAFATTTSVSTMSAFTIDCGTTATPDVKTIEFDISYPFRVDQNTFGVPICNDNGTDPTSVSMHGNYSSAAQFYVFVGVMAFLYTIAAIILYIFFDEKYRKYDYIPKANASEEVPSSYVDMDFVISIVFTAMWLIGSSAWADGVRHMKYYTDPSQLFIDTVPECSGTPSPCTVTEQANYASLNVSLIFGFLNMAVWGGNLWFLYKETRWFKVETEHPQMDESEQPQKF